MNSSESRKTGWRSLPFYALLGALVLLVAVLTWQPIIGVFTAGTQFSSIDDLRQMRAGNRVAFSGIVTFSDQETHTLYVQDDSAALRVRLPGHLALPARGERINVQATLASEYDALVGLRGIKFNEIELRTSGPDTLPVLETLPLGTLHTNMNVYAARRIRTEAVVRSAVRADKQLIIELGDGTFSMPVSIRESNSIDPAPLIDARVEVQGVVHVDQRDRSAPAVVELIVERDADIRVVTPPPAEIARVSSMRALITEPSWLSRGHRVSVTARVLKVESQGSLILVGDTAEHEPILPVQALDANRFAPGDIVQATGWPSIQRFTVLLQHATLESATHIPRPAALALPMMTSIAQIRMLDNVEAGKQYPVKARATITSIRADRHFYFAQWDGQGIYVDAGGQTLAGLDVGKHILIEGLTQTGGFAPVIRHPKVQILGEGALPNPLQIDPERATKGVYESRWVEVEGVVRPVTVTDSYFKFNIAADFGEVGAILVESSPDFKLEDLLDARIRARGVMSAAFTSQGVLNGHRLFIQSLEFIDVVRPPASIERMATRPINQLLRFSVNEDASQRARVEGTVTMRKAGELYIADSSGSLRVETAALDVEPGDRVSVIGYPEPSNHGTILADAIVSQLGTKQALDAQLVSPEEVLKGEIDNRLVKMEARIINIGSTAAQQTLVLKSGFTTFNAQLDHSEPLSSLREGSLVHVTGICDVQRQRPVHRDYDYVPVSFRLLLRNSDDIRVIKTAPWWNLQRVWPLLALLLGLISLSMLWVVGLRRRVRAQTAEIDSQRTFLRSVIDMCPNFIFVKDREGRYTLANKALANSIGCSTEQIIGKTDAAICRSEAERLTRERDDREVIESRAQKEILEEQFTDSMGKVHWMHTLKQPLLDDSGRVTHIVGVANDITLHKQAEATLEKAREAAEAANRAKSEFLANMSHEIRTPLNGVIGMTDLCLDTQLSSEQREYLETVKLSADGLLGVINDILDFSKIEAGKLELDGIDFDLCETLDAALKTLALRAHQKGLELVCDVGAEVPQHLHADSSRLRQVILNLASNAIKFTETGEVALRVRVQSYEQAQYVLQFTIADTGIGIPEERLEHIFTPFTQADSSTTRRYGGTGLGLTICNRLVSMMGGRIWVESTVGKGSQFHFTVKVATAQHPPVNKDAPEFASLSGIRVLIVDDNRTNRLILDEAVTRWGMRPLLASSAREAVQQLELAQDENDPCGLVLTDMNMPEMDGLTMVESILGRPDLLAPVIMMLTSSGQRQDAARCRELGVNHYLVKPIRLHELRESIVRLFGKRHAEARVQQSQPPPSTVDGRLNILLAEDNMVNQLLMVRLLTKRGHRVTVAEHGRAALDAVEQQQFDLVFMDVQMPEVDGFQATRQIRRNERGHSRLPIYALTAHAMVGDRERCEEAGMDGYLTKPIDSKQLDEVLESFAGRKMARSA